MDDLETRTGLPGHLRPLADLYPRQGWKVHGNFDEMTAFWLDRHLMFRRVLAQLIADSQGFLDGAAPRYATLLPRYTGFFLSGLHGHHTIEDQHYFPQLSPLDARLSRGFDLLEADHHVIEAHIRHLNDATGSALNTLEQGGDTRAAVATLLDLQARMQALLDRHLNDEEELVVPVILEYGPELR